MKKLNTIVKTEKFNNIFYFTNYIRFGSSSSASGEFCRICHESDNINPLITPCMCAGSLRYVHQNCLQVSKVLIDPNWWQYKQKIIIWTRIFDIFISCGSQLRKQAHVNYASIRLTSNRKWSHSVNGKVLKWQASKSGDFFVQFYFISRQLYASSGVYAY